MYFSEIFWCIFIYRMAHWFHRNPLKATAPVSFNFYGVAGSPAANKICKYVLSPLNKLRTLLSDCTVTVTMIMIADSNSALSLSLMMMQLLMAYGTQLLCCHLITLASLSYKMAVSVFFLMKSLIISLFFERQLSAVCLTRSVTCGQPGRGCWRCSLTSPATMRS